MNAALFLNSCVRDLASHTISKPTRDRTYMQFVNSPLTLEPGTATTDACFFGLRADRSVLASGRRAEAIHGVREHVDLASSGMRPTR